MICQGFSSSMHDSVCSHTAVRHLVVVCCIRNKLFLCPIDQRIHPQNIVAGWRMATKAARDALEAQAKDHGNDAEKFREDLLNIAR